MLRPMPITFAALPKPFIGHIGIIQRNAIQSWLAQTPRPQVILFGTDEGVVEAAAEFGCEHVPSLRRNQYGTPYLDHVFSITEQRAQGDIICYSNADILLFPDFTPTTLAVAEQFPQFLLGAECTNLWVRELINVSAPWQETIRVRMQAEGTRRMRATDFFTFRKGMYPAFPPLILGRSYFDNAMLYETRRLGFPIVDATGVITAVHQNHFYTAAPGETTQSHAGVEAGENFRLAGGWNHLYWLSERTHTVTRFGIRRSVSGSFLLYHRWKALQRFVRRSAVRLLAAMGLRETPYYARSG